MSNQVPPEALPDETGDSIEEIKDPAAALARIRKRLTQITDDYASGRVNRAQFNAMYRHYIEKRTIIERILERNPESDAWKQVAMPGSTMQLRDSLEARPQYYIVFRRGEQVPLIASGTLSRPAARQIHRLLQVIWKMQTWRVGMARKAMGNGRWILLIMGHESFTMVMFQLQPSSLQLNHARDLHSDFERANRLALQRGYPASRMVFPQRALLEE